MTCIRENKIYLKNKNVYYNIEIFYEMFHSFKLHEILWLLTKIFNLNVFLRNKTC